MLQYNGINNGCFVKAVVTVSTTCSICPDEGTSHCLVCCRKDHLLFHVVTLVILIVAMFNVCVRACVRVCVCACVCARTCVPARVCLCVCRGAAQLPALFY